MKTSTQLKEGATATTKLVQDFVIAATTQITTESSETIQTESGEDLLYEP